MLLHLSYYLAEVHLAQHEECGIVGHIVFARKAQRVGSLVFAQPVGLAQYVASQAVTAEEHLLKIVVYKLGGGVIVAVNLVNDHLHLLVYLFLRIYAVEDDVAQQVHGAGEVLFLHGGIEYCYLLVGEGVEVASHAFQPVAYVPCPPALSALEGHVLAEVGHA